LKDKLFCELPVTTIHRFMGIKDGRFQDREIIDLIQYSDEYFQHKNNILTVDVMLIDEVSMISMKIICQIDSIFRAIRESQMPFGGVQIIMSGDFYQLPPVANPDYMDDGTFMITAPIIQHFHHVTLCNIHRQEENDIIQAVHQLSR